MIYVVKSGDTLFKITQRYVGDGNRYRELLPINPQITDPDYIEVGDMLNIPDAWTGGSSNNLPAPYVPSTPIQTESEGMSNNTKVMLVAGVAIAAALAYWYFGRSTAAANPVGDTGDDITDPDSEYQGGSS